MLPHALKTFWPSDPLTFINNKWQWNTQQRQVAVARQKQEKLFTCEKHFRITSGNFSVESIFCDDETLQKSVKTFILCLNWIWKKFVWDHFQHFSPFNPKGSVFTRLFMSLPFFNQTKRNFRWTQRNRVIYVWKCQLEGHGQHFLSRISVRTWSSRLIWNYEWVIEL